MASKINGMSFNHDASCFAVCGTSGVHVFATDPLVHLAAIDSSLIGSTVRRVEMLDRSNLLALLYYDASPDFSENVVRIWDNSLKRFILHFSFPDTVQTVRLLNPVIGTFMLVATSNRLHVYRLLPCVQHISEFETADMAPTRLAVSVTPSDTRFAFPIIQSSSELGVRRAASASSASKSAISIRVLESLVQQYESRAAMSNAAADGGNGRHGNSHHAESLSRMPVTVQAHQNAIAVLAMNREGSLLATASTKGTLIRVFSVATSKKLVTFRRGVDESLHFALAFSTDSRLLVSASHKGTVHIFSLDSSAARQQRSVSLGGFFLDELKSIASFTLPPDTETLIAFGSPNSSVALTSPSSQYFYLYSVLRDGTYHKHALAADGSTCVRETFERFDELFTDDL